MRAWTFDLIVNQKVNDDTVDALYAKASDMSVIGDGAVTRIAVDRKALELSHAISSALADVGSVGLRVDRVELDPSRFSR